MRRPRVYGAGALRDLLDIHDGPIRECDRMVQDLLSPGDLEEVDHDRLEDFIGRHGGEKRGEAAPQSFTIVSASCWRLPNGCPVAGSRRPFNS